MQNFRALGATSPVPVPPAAGGFAPNPQPPAAGGFAPRPPLASGGWGLRPQTPIAAPLHCEFLATRLEPELYTGPTSLGANPARTRKLI